MTTEYPHAMYRPGTQHRGVWGAHDVDMHFAEDADHEMDLRAKGWTRRPDGADAIEADKPRRGRPPKDNN